MFQPTPMNPLRDGLQLLNSVDVQSLVLSARMVSLLDPVTDTAPAGVLSSAVEGFVRIVHSDGGGNGSTLFVPTTGEIGDALLLTYENESPLNAYGVSDEKLGYHLQRALYEGVEDFRHLFEGVEETYEHLNVSLPDSPDTLLSATGVFSYTDGAWRASDGLLWALGHPTAPVFAEAQIADFTGQDPLVITGLEHTFLNPNGLGSDSSPFEVDDDTNAHIEGEVRDALKTDGTVSPELVAGFREHYSLR